MKIKHFAVYITRSPGGDGMGPSVCIGRFINEHDAIAYAKGKDEWGQDGRVKYEELEILDSGEYSLDMYTEWVFHRLPVITSKEFIISITNEIARRFNKGWSKEDTLAFCKLMEEVNPDISESLALNKMAKISEKYEKH